MRLLMLGLLVGGCVPKGRYEVAQIQLGATRTALSAREAASRSALDEAREREALLQTRVAEVEELIAVQNEHALELEAEVDRLAAVNAEHVLADQAECVVDPDVELAPDDPVGLRRTHVDAALNDVVAALAERARTRMVVVERQRKHESVMAAFAKLVEDGRLEVVQTDDGSMVRLLVAKLYNENRTSVSPLGLAILRDVSAALQKLQDHDVTIVGHTDDVPYNSALLHSNWELGFAYAAGVLRTLRDMGTTLPLVAGSRAETDPVVPFTDAESRRLNRRVELYLVPRVLALPVVESETDDGSTPDDPSTADDPSTPDDASRDSRIGPARDGQEGSP